MCFFAPTAMQNSNIQQSNLSKKFRHFYSIYYNIYLEHKLLPYALGTPLGFTTICHYKKCIIYKKTLLIDLILYVFY